MRGWQLAQRSLTYGEVFKKRSFSAARAQLKTRTVADWLQQQTDAQDVTVDGWIRSVRKQKRVVFAAISDGSTIDSLQAVLSPDDAAEYGDHSRWTSETLIYLVGFRPERLSN